MRIATRRGWLVGIGIVVTTILAGVTLIAQPLSPQIQLAITQLTTGIIPFSVLRLIPSGYINFGTDSGSAGYGIRDNAGVIQFKQSGGSWVPLPASGAFPVTATYWTRVADPDLTNETVLGALGTGLIVNTTTTGIPTIYAGGTCTNQFVRAVSASGALTCATVNLATMSTGVVPVANGGTGLSAGTSGGILAFSAAGTLVSSGVLPANQLLLGGGAGAAPIGLGSSGSATTVLHGNASGAPTFAAVSLTADITGTLGSANGGTGSAFFAITGPTALRTFTFPNANATVLTSGTTVTTAQGGTGFASYAVGDLLQASGATTLAKLPAVSTGNALISGGAGTGSSWGKIGLTTHTTGVLPVAQGGTNLTSYAIGDLLYGSGAAALAKLTAVAPGSVLVSTGVGTAPAWSDVPGTLARLTSVLAKTFDMLGDSAGSILMRLQTTTAGDDPIETATQYRLTTTDATLTPLATFTIPQFKTTMLACRIVARRTGGASGAAGDAGGYDFDVVLQNESGTVVEVSAETSRVVGRNQATWTVSGAPAAGTYLVQVSGTAANNVTWHATCRSWEVGS